MTWLFRFLVAGVVLVICANVAHFVSGVVFRADHPPVGGVQRGPRGTGLVFVYNPTRMQELFDANQVPESVPQASNDGTKASDLYRNLRVLGDVGADEFTRLMVNMTNWVAPAQGCAGCHNTADFADDGLYTKVVARRMLQMVRHINADWTAHVAHTGVTCFTCHRGQLVPPNVWFNNPGPQQAAGFAQLPAGKNHPTPVAGGSALPADPYTPFLEQATDVRIQSKTPLRQDDHLSIKQAEWSYAFMMSISQALGVNCDYCHNTRSFGDWSSSPPQRVTAWYGIRMVRNLNNDFLDPLRSEFPPNRLGAASGDAPKINCATCHNGVYKPLFGVSMAQDFPELTGTPAPQAPARSASAAQ